MTEIIGRAAVPVALMAAIFYLSAQPAVAPELPGWTRVLAHFVQFIRPSPDFLCLHRASLHVQL